MTSDEEAFLRNHGGGFGAVWCVMAFSKSGEERNAIFSRYDLAQRYVERDLGEGFSAVYSPYIVDDPDWGNEADERRRPA